MKPVSQGSDLSGFDRRIVAAGVPAVLVVLAAIMVLLNHDDSSSTAALVALAFVAVLFVVAWKTAPVVSLAGLAAVTLLWALLELPGSPGILMVAPLGWFWSDRTRSREHCLFASVFAIAVAAIEGAISLANNNGTLIDLVGNLALVLVVVAVGAIIRNLTAPLAADTTEATTDGPVVPRPDHPTPAWVDELSPREREVLAELVDGASNNEIADRLHIGLSTVKTHVSSILRKSGAQSRYAVALELRPGPSASLSATAEHNE